MQQGFRGLVVPGRRVAQADQHRDDGEQCEQDGDPAPTPGITAVAPRLLARSTGRVLALPGRAALGPPSAAADGAARGASGSAVVRPARSRSSLEPAVADGAVRGAVGCRLLQQGAGLRDAHPLGRVLGEQAEDRLAQRPTHLRRHDRVVDDRGERAERVLPVVRRSSLGRGVERGAERPHVGLRARLLAAGPLRRHVGGGAEDHAGRRQRRVARHGRDAEVGQDRAAVVVDQDVAGLDVAVHDALAMGELQRAEHLQPDLGHSVRREGAILAEQITQAAGPEQLHHDVGKPVLLHHVVGSDDVRVAQAGSGTSLAQSPLAQLLLLLLAELRREADLLDSHGPAENLVVAAPDGAHSAMADGLLEAVSTPEEPGCRVRRAHRGCPLPRSSDLSPPRRPISGVGLEGTTAYGGERFRLWMSSQGKRAEDRWDDLGNHAQQTNKRRFQSR